jgi:D-beta-D-heptose 7-phosphate kinase/D-beta-D-heptose 1-phosphate adenosyltransferase
MGDEEEVQVTSDVAGLQDVLDRFRVARVLCLGDLMLDRFVYGQVDRVSAEAPVQIIHVSEQRQMLGGVGNVGCNVEALGARAVVIGVTGDDDTAKQILALAEAEKRLEPRLIVEPGRPSTVKTRFIADSQQLLRADEESTAPISDETARRVVAALREELADTDVLVISDYMKGLLTDDLLRTAIDAARAAGVPVIADPKRHDFEAYAGVTLLKPNRAELAQAARMPCTEDAEVEDAAREVMRSCGIDAMLVSRSERGMSLLLADAKPLHLPGRALEVFDVSGAGDTVVATTAVALAAGADLVAAARIANVAGGIVVGKLGTASVSREELLADMRPLDDESPVNKVMSPKMAEAAIERWRQRGQRVGFTNGCFDLLHPGHVSLLGEASAACDKLIVALNSDTSVKRLKGDDRPVQSEVDRAIVLASLATVDMVIVFAEDTPIPLLDRLRPDVLIKGGDYTIDEVVGAEVVQAYGGQIKLAHLIPGHSSTQVIARMGDREISDD